MRNALKDYARRLDGQRLLPLAFFVVLPALAVRARFVLVAPDVAALWPGTYLGDTRSWWKAALVVGIGLWMAAHAGLRLAGGWRPRFRAYGLLLALAAAATLLSAALSPFPRTAWLGYTAQYEGGLVLLAYLAAMWYAAEMAEPPEWRRLLLRLAGGVGLVNAVHGILEGLGWHFWRTGPGAWLLGADPDAVTFHFADTGLAYGTVFQPNHFGLLMAMTAALAAGMAFREPGRGWTAFWAVTAACSLLAVVFSHSRTALAVAAVVLAASAALCLPARLRCGTGKTRLRAPLAAAAILAVLALTAVLWPGVGGRTGDAARALTGRILDTFAATPPPPRVLAVGLENDEILVHDPDGVLALRRDAPDAWTARREDAAPLSLAFHRRPDGWLAARLPGCEEAALMTRPDGNVILSGPGFWLRFFNHDGRLLHVDANGICRAFLPGEPAPDFPVFGNRLGGRGSIWARALSLVRERPFLGSGPGAFAPAFPADDPLHLQRILDGSPADKGHGVWITFLVQLGGIGLVLFCLPVIYALARTVRGGGPLAGPMAAAMAAFILGSVTNDSTPGVTPLFCVLTGLTLADAEDRPAPTASDKPVPHVS